MITQRTITDPYFVYSKQLERKRKKQAKMDKKALLDTKDVIKSMVCSLNNFIFVYEYLGYLKETVVFHFNTYELR